MLPHPYDIIFCGMEIDHIYIRKINRNKTANLAVIVMCVPSKAKERNDVAILLMNLVYI